MDGITADVVGALISATGVIASKNISDIPTALIAVATIFALLYFRKIQEPLIIAVVAILGIIIKLIVWNENNLWNQELYLDQLQ